MANAHISFTGTLGQDPVILSNGGLRLRVAVNERAKNPTTGEWEDKYSSWYTVKVWGALADSSKKLLKKGIEVTITGDIYEETWTTDTGDKRSSYEVRANTLAITPFGISKLNLTTKGQFSDTERYAEVPF